MIRFVNAKINLGLNILRKRNDGYHDLETLFYPVGLYNGTPVNPDPFNDILEIHRLGKDRVDEFIFTGKPVDCPTEKNLVVRAIHKFKEAVGAKDYPTQAFKIRLDKHLPDGAGLGGGSADASFTLLAANELCSSPLSRQELIKVAASIGADCPFFIENRPMFATGIGELMRPAKLNLDGYWAVIVKPDVYVSTKEAFAGITPALPEKRIEEIIDAPIEDWERLGLKNDFEKNIFALHPELSLIKNRLKASGALYACMSGSGSSLFGIFEGEALARKAAGSFSIPAFIVKL